MKTGLALFKTWLQIMISLVAALIPAAHFSHHLTCCCVASFRTRPCDWFL